MDAGLKKARIEILLLFLLYLVVLPRVYMEYDMGWWRQWALEIHRHGLQNAYKSTINYFPVYLYALWIYDKLQVTEANIAAHINYIKVFFVFFDFLPLLVLSCWRQRLLRVQIPHLYLLLNVAYVFNSMVWGQIDSIYTNLSFLAIVTAFAYPAAAAALYVLALNTKPQAIEFLPVVLLALWYGTRQVKTVVAVLATAAAVQLLLVAPFMANGGIRMLLTHAATSVDRYHNLSISAFNFWYLVQPGNPYFINDTDVFVVFSYKTIGLTLFLTASAAVLWPMARMLWRQRKEGTTLTEDGWKTVFLATGLVCLYFFYFNSQMHERYAHPIIIFFFFYSILARNYWLYILSSVAYFLSLDKAFSFPDGFLPITHYKLIFASKVIALWYSAAVVYGSWLYYKTVKQSAMRPMSV